MHKQYRKINIYDKKTGEYLCSTTKYRTCKECKEAYIKIDPFRIGILAQGILLTYKHL